MRDTTCRVPDVFKEFATRLVLSEAGSPCTVTSARSTDFVSLRGLTMSSSSRIRLTNRLDVGEVERELRGVGLRSGAPEP